MSNGARVLEAVVIGDWRDGLGHHVVARKVLAPIAERFEVVIDRLEPPLVVGDPVLLFGRRTRRRVGRRSP